MHLINLGVLALIVTGAGAFPIYNTQLFTRQLKPRAAVFTKPMTYDQLSVAGGVAGKAKQEVLAKFAGLPKNPKEIDPADLKFLDAVTQICDAAERAVYVPELNKAGQTTERGKAIQRAIIKNKVMKGMADVLRLQGKLAHGSDATQAQIDKEQAKVNKNVKLDEAQKGLKTIAFKFNASTADPGKANASKTSDSKKTDSKTKDSKTGGSKTSDTKTESKKDDSKTGGSKTSSSKTESKTDDPKTDGSKTSDTKTESKKNDSKTGGSKTSDSKTDSKTNESKRSTSETTI